MKMRLGNRAGAILFLLIGGIIMAVVIYQSLLKINFLANAITTQGVVESINVDTVRNSGVKRGSKRPQTEEVHFPLIAFTTASGEVLTFQSRVASQSYTQGDAVVVVYNPQNLKQAEIKSLKVQWGGLLFASIFGIIFLGFGFLFKKLAQFS
jgi:hypothetical protein